MADLIIKRFNHPDETRVFEKGKFEILKLPEMTIGKATYRPGWIWSKDVSPLSETEFCNVEHLGMVLEGSATVVFYNAEIKTLLVGDVFYVPLNRMIAGFLANKIMFQYTFLVQIHMQGSKAKYSIV